MQAPQPPEGQSHHAYRLADKQGDCWVSELDLSAAASFRPGSNVAPCRHAGCGMHAWASCMQHAYRMAVPPQHVRMIDSSSPS